MYNTCAGCLFDKNYTFYLDDQNCGCGYNCHKWKMDTKWIVHPKMKLMAEFSFLGDLGLSLLMNVIIYLFTFETI